MMLAKTFLVAVLGASAANAHMLMTHPVPYGKDSLNNSPLEAEGGDFPCKLRGDTYTVTTENIMESGSRQQLHLQGQATHGGGSCQISLTEDRAPSKSTTWKVIQSIEGGCPANVDGNMGGDASAADPTFFNYTIPTDFAPGKYTLAWTWFNRIGNREMYMNCAPVTITNSAAKRSNRVPVVEKRTANYPPMFVANVNGCTTKEGIDIRFPQPGTAVDYNGQPANLAPEGEAACSGTPKFGGDGNTSSGSSGSSGSGSGSSSSSSTAAGSAPTETSTQAGSPVPTSTSAPVETSVPGIPQPAVSTTAPVAPSSSSSGDSGALTGSCSPEGAWNCVAGSSFQRCANGQWTPTQNMATGTQCTAGKSADLTISAVKAAREVSAMRFRKRFIGDSHHA
ncbi:uncharacterized protein N7473_003543 [Penicillium subrubescens]|uniref:Chitin-binding type-4 domain-containing protein n=1 Tax=Penicillium subrubescens TaxID=1316194 RepID=A0A1Q5THV6_9EURO|nr:uncharacterized protein N7473_003543 [Penicillium subrubescens]KAJ5906627.1 hypothetical protein N7473_003543 [Penicillium subrubescens]OKO99801.1 hypothetical protein PENSUB_8018 [Penicillium subrubescens]